MKKDNITSGVADNKSYKDQYYFKDNFNVKGADLPSLNDEPAINSTIKANPYHSNVEIEGKEVVLQPDLTALFKAVGKRHSQGGMDVMLRPNSFVFSDDKSLGISDGEHKLFELKEGGRTPAEVLKRNINVKHYNTTINNLKDPVKDDLTKNSSALMLEKYINTLGNIAYIQEKKKGFPTGLPPFSQGTAPVYDPSVKQEVMEAKQFAKYGGKINPYAALGGNDPECPCGRDKDGNCIPNCPPEAYQKMIPTAKRVTTPPLGYNELYQDPTGTLLGAFTNQKKQYYSGPVTKFMGNDKWAAWLKTPAGQAYTNRGRATNEDYAFIPKTNAPPPPGFTPPPATGDQPIPNIQPNGVNGNAQIGKQVPWEFTPWQKLSQAYNWGQYAGVQRYMPYRSRFNATYAQPDLVNPEQVVGDIRGQVNDQVASLSALNPILRNTQASSMFGKQLEAIPGVRSQYDNQNAGITNQFREYNNQIKNQETQTNMGADQQYYHEAVAGRQNFNNMRGYLANQAMSETMGDVATNQKLAYNLMTLDNPAYGYDWKTGNFTRNKMDIRDSVQRGSQESFDAMIGQVMKMKESGLDPSIISSIVRGRYLQMAAPYFKDNEPNPGGYKKGGRVNPYK